MPLAFSPLLPPFQGPSAFSTDSLSLFLLDYFVLLCPNGLCLYSCGLCWEFWFYSYNWTPCSFSLFVSPTSSVLGVLQSVRKTTSVFCTRSRILMFPRVGLDSGSAHLSFLSTGVTGLSHSSFPKDLACLLTDTWIHPSSTRRGQRLTLGIPHYLKHSVCVNVCGVYRWHSTHVEFRG